MTPRPPACSGCPLCPSTPGYDAKKSGPFVPPKGPEGSLLDPENLPALSDLDLAIIGMAPSYREVDEGEPLVGPSFVEMRRGLGPAMDEARILKLNYVNCRTWKPGKTIDFVNREPTALEAKACSQRWLIPILRALGVAERPAEYEERDGGYRENIAEPNPIHLWVLGQKAFDVVFQGKYGTFGGSKGSRGQRINRRQESYSILADRIEKWVTKNKKTRFCKDCQTKLMEPRVRMCPECREKKAKSKGKSK